MKKIVILVCIIFAQCNSKSNEDRAKELIKEKLRTELPDFNSYESISFGTLGNALLPYEETDKYLNNKKIVRLRPDPRHKNF